MFKLMIKIHNDTGLKYLCITKRERYEDYLGSGKYWLNHLQKYGANITTQLLFQTENYNVFIDKCQYYSKLFSVASSSEWANLVPETGYNNNDGLPNVVLFWRSIDEEMKHEIIKRRNESIKKNHWSKSENSEAIKLAIIEKSGDWWKNMSENEKREKADALQKNCKKWRKTLSPSEKKRIWEKSLGEWYKNATFEELSKKNRKARLNMTPEAKEKRKKKLQALHATGKFDYLWEKMSQERQGGNNPSARRVKIDGKIYSCIKDACECLGVTRAVLTRKLNSEKYPTWERL